MVDHLTAGWLKDFLIAWEAGSNVETFKGLVKSGKEFDGDSPICKDVDESSDNKYLSSEVFPSLL